MGERKYESLSRQIFERLIDIKEGELITWEELGELVGEKPESSRLKNAFDRANKKILADQDYGYYFENERGVGYRRVPNDKVPSKVNKTRRKATQNQIKAWSNDLYNGFDFKRGSREAQQQYTMGIAVAGVMEMIAKEEAAPVVQEIQASKSLKLNVGDFVNHLANIA